MMRILLNGMTELSVCSYQINNHTVYVHPWRSDNMVYVDSPEHSYNYFTYNDSHYVTVDDDQVYAVTSHKQHSYENTPNSNTSGTSKHIYTNNTDTSTQKIYDDYDDVDDYAADYADEYEDDYDSWDDAYDDAEDMWDEGDE